MGLNISEAILILSNLDSDRPEVKDACRLAVSALRGGVYILKQDYRMLKVTDNWCPNYEGDTVRLTVALSKQRDKYYGRISAWGMDDTGVELWQEADNEQAALNMFYDLYKKYKEIPDGVTFDWFLERGFKSA